MRHYRSAEYTVDDMISPLSGRPTADLVRLVEIHGGEYNSDDGLPGLQEVTQRLWLPIKGGRRIKLRETDIATRDAAYGKPLRSESWELLGKLGCLEGFEAHQPFYSFVLMHRTVPQQAAANLAALVHSINETRLVGRHGIFMLGTPFIPAAEQGSLTEAGWLAKAWQDMPHTPAPLQDIPVHVISASDARKPHPRPVVPSTADCLRAMFQCCFSVGAEADPFDDFRVQRVYANFTILNLAATQLQLLRQHVETRAFFRSLGIRCEIETINAFREEKRSLTLALHELARLVRSVHKEQMNQLSGSTSA